MKKYLSRSYLAVVLSFLYLPLSVLMLFSFNDSKLRSVWTGFTLDWYKELFNNSVILDSFRNTLIVAFIATAVATLIGTIAAIGINNMNKGLKMVVMNITYLPIINPEIVTGVSLMLLYVFMRNTLNIPIEAGFTTLILAHITFCIPYVILNVLPKLRQLDGSIYEAASDLGCNPIQTITRVIIPEIMPGIVAGALIAFTMSIDDFVISYFVSGPTSQTLPITIYSMTRKRVSPEINALSTIIFGVVLLILFISNYLDIRKETAQKALEQED
ncbi:MAG: ABC transporter permease [Clostridia bacterium]